MATHSPSKKGLTRRQVMARLGAVGAGATLGAHLVGPARAQGGPEPRFLIVLAAAGGASIIDGPLAIRHRETPNWQSINAFPDEEVVSIDGTELRAVDLRRGNAGAIPFPFQSNQSDFVRRHKDDMLVVTHTGTSVNHAVAQKRSLTGNDAWNGRTLQEVVALTHGEGYPLPNVNMAGQGFATPGIDDSIPPWAFAETVVDPALWTLGLDGRKGIRGAPEPELIELAREVRDGKLDAESTFWRTFEHNEALQRWRRQRQHDAPVLEGLDLITRLNILPDSPQVPLSEYGLQTAADSARVREAFPDFLTDPLEAQAAMAFMLLKNRVSVTVTISPSFQVLLEGQRALRNPPLAFDFSHQAHRAAQAIMWDRMLGIADRLIGLLKAEPLDEAAGVSFWDRSLIYFATDFGRSKRRSSGADGFGSGHDLNNGSLLVSPLVQGNTVLGGVDAETGLTYGFDPRTGEPDRARTMVEAEVYAGILQALDVQTPAELPDVPAMRRG